MVSKSWLFSLGGRPVIYESENEYFELPETHNWRHVKYEPDKVPPFDFQWEREWRIKTQELHFSSENVTLILPDKDWAQHMIQGHDNSQDWDVQQYNMLLGEPLGELFRDSFKWRILSLK